MRFGFIRPQASVDDGALGLFLSTWGARNDEAEPFLPEEHILSRLLLRQELVCLRAAAAERACQRTVPARVLPAMVDRFRLLNAVYSTGVLPEDRDQDPLLLFLLTSILNDTLDHAQHQDTSAYARLIAERRIAPTPEFLQLRVQSYHSAAVNKSDVITLAEVGSLFAKHCMVAKFPMVAQLGSLTYDYHLRGVAAELSRYRY